MNHKLKFRKETNNKRKYPTMKKLKNKQTKCKQYTNIHAYLHICVIFNGKKLDDVKQFL